MIDQLNNLLQRLTGFKLEYHGKYVKRKTMADHGYYGTGGLGNVLIGRAYLPTQEDN